MKGTIIADDAYYMGIMSGVNHATKLAKDATAVDAVPVVHGRWVFVEVPDLSWYGHKPGWYCSQCGWKVTDKSRKLKTLPMRFCPNCGARMDGEKE